MSAAPMPLLTDSTSKAQKLIATLSNSHYYDFNSTANFYDHYDPNFSGSGLDLPARFVHTSGNDLANRVHRGSHHIGNAESALP